jgi:hypothetical protein
MGGRGWWGERESCNVYNIRSCGSTSVFVWGRKREEREEGDASRAQIQMGNGWDGKGATQRCQEISNLFPTHALPPPLSLMLLVLKQKSPTIQGFNQTSFQYLLVGCCPHGSLHLLIEDHTYESTKKTPPNNTLEGNTIIISVVIY